MIYKLERWAWFGGAMLAGNAGMVNAVALRSYAHQAVTHATGTTSLLSLAAAHQEYTVLANLAIVLLSFVLGAAVGGFLIQNATLKLGRRYGAALLIESLLLAGAAVLMRSHNTLGSYLASAACGLQNAMASTYSGAVLRTTHLSGMFTDIGVLAGHGLRGLGVDWIRFRLYTMLIGSFALGGVIGSLLFDRFAADTLYFPAALIGLVAAVYTIYAHFKRRAASS